MRSFKNEMKSLEEYRSKFDTGTSLGKGVFEKPVSTKRRRSSEKENEMKPRLPPHKVIRGIRIGSDYQAELPDLGTKSEERNDQPIIYIDFPHFHAHVDR